MLNICFHQPNSGQVNVLQTINVEATSLLSTGHPSIVVFFPVLWEHEHSLFPILSSANCLSLCTIVCCYEAATKLVGEGTIKRCWAKHGQWLTMLECGQAEKGRDRRWKLSAHSIWGTIVMNMLWCAFASGRILATCTRFAQRVEMKCTCTVSLKVEAC